MLVSGDDPTTASHSIMFERIPNSGEFLDEHEEQHAVPTGMALGFAAISTGDYQRLGFALTIIVEGVERGRDRPPAAEKQDLANDIRREPHYFAAGLVLGGFAGVAARAVQ